MSKISHRKCLRGKWIFFRRSLGGPRTETTFQKWSASLKRLRTAAIDYCANGCSPVVCLASVYKKYQLKLAG